MGDLFPLSALQMAQIRRSFRSHMASYQRRLFCQLADATTGMSVGLGARPRPLKRSNNVLLRTINRWTAQESSSAVTMMMAIRSSAGQFTYSNT